MWVLEKSAAVAKLTCNGSVMMLGHGWDTERRKEVGRDYGEHESRFGTERRGYRALGGRYRRRINAQLR